MIFQMSINVEGTAIRCALGGDIDERAQMKTDFTLKPVLVVELSGVKMINSVGVDKWIKWVTALQMLRKDLIMVFRRVPYVVARTMNTVEGFLPKRFEIESLSVPYYCGSCDTNHDFLMIKGRDYVLGPDFKFVEARVDCPKCQSRLELDVMPDKFFQFLRQSISVEAERKKT
jgi:hypothetical protein